MSYSEEQTSEEGANFELYLHGNKIAELMVTMRDMVLELCVCVCVCTCAKQCRLLDIMFYFVYMYMYMSINYASEKMRKQCYYTLDIKLSE